MKPDELPRIPAFAEAPANEFAEQFRFWRRCLSKHKWSALGLAALIAMLAALVAFQMRPVYRSTATLMIEASKAKVVSIEEVYSSIAGSREFFQTQAEILRSQDLARKVIARLGLEKHPALDPRQAGPAFDFNWRAWLPAGALPAPEPLSDAKVAELVAREFERNLTVQPVRNSQLIKLSYDSHDRELAAKVPNVLAEVYVETDLDQKMQMTQKAGAWLMERLGDLRGKLERSERGLQEYRERERIIDTKNLAQSGSTKQLEELGSQLVAARQRRNETEAAYEQLQAARRAKTDLESLPAVIRNQSFARFKEMEAEADRKISELKQRYGSEHARMIEAEAQLRAARENTRRQLDSVVASIVKDFEIARSNEQAIERSLGQIRGEIQNINRKEFQLGVLDREAASNRQMYEMFMQRSKETNIAGDLQSTVARVVDPATVASIPHAPNKTRVIAVAALIGLVLGVMLAFLLESLDNTIKNSDDVEQRLGLPVLGILQKLSLWRKSMELYRAILTDKHPAFTEAVRTVRTAVMLSALDTPNKVLLITSSISEEGKTAVSVNLAIALGQVRKVCLVDADMRRPTVAQALGLDAALPGLSNLVAGTEPANRCVHYVQSCGIHVVPSGAIPPNPLELLASKRFDEALKKLKETFDIVLMDSPPVQLVSDAMVLARHASAVLYVVKADATPYQVAQSGVERLRSVQAPLLGVVLNQLDIARADRYYGYGRYRGYAKKYGDAAYPARKG